MASQTNKTQTLIALSLIFLALAVNFISALSISTSQDILYPGSQADIAVKVENTLDKDIKDVSFGLTFTSQATSPLFTSVGSSQESVDEIEEDDSESFDFIIRASNSIEPGIYSLPYVLTYKDDNQTVTEQGTIGITVNSKTKLDFIALTDKPAVVGQKGKLTLKIINNGFGEVKFVSVNIQPQGYTLLTEDKVYIGSIASDDFETAVFDVIYKKTNARLVATVIYKTFENVDKIENVDLDFKIYTQEEALKQGVIQPNRSGYYVTAAVVILIAWFVYRKIRKARREKLRKEMNNQIKSGVR